MVRGDIITLRHFFNGEPPPGKTHLQFLTEGLLVFFFSSRHLLSISKPPRRKAVKAYRLISIVPGALTICEFLVLWTFREGGIRRFKLKNRIFEILEEEGKFKEYLDRFNLNAFNRIRREPYRNAITIYLVHRAFIVAWEAFGHPALLNMKPEEVLREYHYGKKNKLAADLLKKAKSLYDPTEFDKLMRKWIDLYLGDLGAAAKALFPDL